jgi:DNA-binding beta-propeller fold protein YncE
MESPELELEIPVGLEPVSVAALTEDQVWVVNQVSDSISIVSVKGGLVIETLQTGDHPEDIVFAGDRAFVSVGGRNELLVYNAFSFQLVRRIPLNGVHPSALAVSKDHKEVYVVFTFSGNRTTVLPPDKAPLQTFPDRNELPPHKTAMIVNADDPEWRETLGYSLVDHDVARIDAESLEVKEYYSHIGTILFGIAVHPLNGDLYVSNTEARNQVRFQSVLRGHVVDHRVTRIIPESGHSEVFDLNADTDYSLLPNPEARNLALAQPTALKFDASGNTLFLAAFGSDRLAEMHPKGTISSRADLNQLNSPLGETKLRRGPRGLAFDGPRHRVYVLNRISNTLSVYDTVSKGFLTELAVGRNDPTPMEVKLGRGFLYDAGLSGNGLISCAVCHIDGESDRLAWDLGDPFGQPFHRVIEIFHQGPTQSMIHPFKGPLVTQTLRGLSENEPFHWRGDRPDLESFNDTFEDLMGGKRLSEPGMKLFKRFLLSLEFSANPNLTLMGSLPEMIAGGDPRRGFDLYKNHKFFEGFKCGSCHSRPSGGNKAVLDAGSFLLSQPFKIPHLRNLYKKTDFDQSAGAESFSGFGLAPDGSFDTMSHYLSQPFFGNIRDDESIKIDLNAYLLCFDTGTAPAVGHTVTISPGIRDLEGRLMRIQILQEQAELRGIDLVGLGVISGRRQGLIYWPKTARYHFDNSNQEPLTLEGLIHFAEQGSGITLMGVPPGSGLRMGIDRNQDGIPNGNSGFPEVRIQRTGGKVLLQWSASALSYRLEQSSVFFQPLWLPIPDSPELNGNNFQVEFPISDSDMMFRLVSNGLILGAR